MSSQALLHHAPLAAPVSGGRSHSACARRSARLQPLPRRSSHRLRTAAAATPKSSNGAVPPKAPEAGAWDKDTHIIPPTAAKSGKADTSSDYTSLRRTPLSGGVKNATDRFELPTPDVAVRNLVEQAQFGHLCTLMSDMHHRRAGYPFGSVVDFACDGAGSPIFSLSPLAMHTRNLQVDSRCTLVVQMPGWQGLSNARVTIFGDVYKLPDNMQDAARKIFKHKHSTGAGEEWIGGNSTYYRMHTISDMYFVGGFGTVAWVDIDEYRAAQPDPIVYNMPQVTLQLLNETFCATLKTLLSTKDAECDDAAIISIDKMGVDVRVRFGHEYSVERLAFDEEIHTRDRAVEVLTEVCASQKTFESHNRSAYKTDSSTLSAAYLNHISKKRDQ
eukprot:jgi/Tetstr1/461309/TSEL_006436.t1